MRDERTCQHKQEIRELTILRFAMQVKEPIDRSQCALRSINS